jgi:hypothetical protein
MYRPAGLATIRLPRQSIRAVLIGIDGFLMDIGVDLTASGAVLGIGAAWTALRAVLRASCVLRVVIVCLARGSVGTQRERERGGNPPCAVRVGRQHD